MSDTPTMRRILVVDDDRNSASSIADKLGFEEYVVECAFTGQAAIRMSVEFQPELVLLNWVLPDVSGLAVLAELSRLASRPAVIILSSLQSDWDRELAYSLGATKHITKPLSLLELLGCGKTILEGVSPAHMRSAIQINKRNHSVCIKGEIVHFPLKEFEMLSLLVESSGAVVSKREFLDKIWLTTADITTTTVESHMKNIRARLKRFGLHTWIVTVAKVGYKWERGTGHD